MIDPVIDEHFRRSLGADYAALFGNNRKPGAAIKPTPIPAPKKQSQLPPSIAITATVMTAHAGHGTGSSSSSSANSPTIAVATVSPTMAAISPVVQPPPQHSPTPNAASSVGNSSGATVTLPLSAIVAPTVRSSPSAATAPMRRSEQQQRQQQPSQPPPPPSNSDVTEDVGMSVDDHFAKALGGDTWKQLQRAESRNEESTASAASAIAGNNNGSLGASRTRVKHEVME